MTTQGFGERYPVAPNTTATGADNPAGGAQNRRVEVVIPNNERGTRMATGFKAFTASIGAVVLSVGLATGAWGRGVGAAAPTAGGAGVIGGELTGSMTMEGSVVCGACTLDKVSW